MGTKTIKKENFAITIFYFPKVNLWKLLPQNAKFPAEQQELVQFQL